MPDLTLTTAYVGPVVVRHGPRAGAASRSHVALQLAGDVFDNLVPADSSDRLHDREPVPVDPRVDDPAVLDLIPRAGGCLPFLAARGIAAERAKVRASRPHADRDQVSLRDLMLEAHLEIRKRRHETTCCRLESLVRGHVVDALEIFAHEGGVEIAPHHVSRFS